MVYYDMIDYQLKYCMFKENIKVWITGSTLMILVFKTK